MATKSGHQEPEKAGVIEEMLDALETSVDRVKVLYEQYFLGIQKQPPTYIHTDIERKIRDLSQLQIRNTALRYRFATLQQKYGSYNSYWRRTLRQIESGTYVRNLSKIGRQAARTGADVPEEILAAMPKRMRDQVKRDREAALALARLRQRPTEEPDLQALADEVVDVDLEDLDAAAFVGESTDLRRNMLAGNGAQRIDEADADFDVDAFFAAVTHDDAPAPPAVAPRAPIPVGRPDPAVAEAPGGAAGSPPRAIPASGPADPRRAELAGQPPVAARPTAAARPATAEPLDDQTEPDMPSYVPSAGRTVGAPDRPGGGSPPARRPIAPSQAVRPLPIVPGSAAIRPVAPVETLAGPFPRIPSPPATSNGQRAMPPPHPQTSPIARAPVDGGAAPPPIPARHSQAVPTARPPIPPGERTPAPERIAPERTPIPERVPGERTPPPIPGAAAPRRPAPAGPPGSRTPPPERMTREPASVEAVGSTGFPRHPAPPRVPGARPERSEHPEPEPRQAPPPGMSDADVNALYAKYIKAKQILGEDAGPGAYTKLLRTINAQAPKIMEQYRSRGVDFSVVVKDNQVIIRAKPKP